jgi:hypothetical protein
MRSIFINFYILFTIGFSYVSLAQETSYKRVRLNATSTQLQKLSNEGLSIDHGHRKGNTIIVEISNLDCFEMICFKLNYLLSYFKIGNEHLCYGMIIDLNYGIYDYYKINNNTFPDSNMDNFAKNTIFINMLLFFIYYTKIFK